MWGAKLNQDRINISLATKEMLQLNHTLAKGFDQTLLWGFIWPIAKHDMVNEITELYLSVKSGQFKCLLFLDRPR